MDSLARHTELVAVAGGAAEAVIAALAERQHGVVARAQLIEAGLTRAAIDWQIRRRRLHGLHRGIYQVGPLPQAQARLMTALLLGGRSARLSHFTAAVLFRLLEGAAPGIVDVAVAQNRRVPGWVRLHRHCEPREDEVTLHDQMPVTTPARTLLDLASVATGSVVEQALLEAVRRNLTDRRRLEALLARHPRRSGIPLLRGLLERLDNSQLTRSEAERKLREIIRMAELGQPGLNTRVEGYEVDAFFHRERVAIEVDGLALHSSNSAFQRDRRRDADLAAAGVTVIRFTWHQLTRRPLTVAARLGSVLAVARERRAGHDR